MFVAGFICGALVAAIVIFALSACVIASDADTRAERLDRGGEGAAEGAWLNHVGGLTK